jgi:hypothetical protein
MLNRSPRRPDIVVNAGTDRSLACLVHDVLIR